MKPKTKARSPGGRAKARADAQRTLPARSLAARVQPGTTLEFPIVGIGASAGGLEAFTQLLNHLPLDTGMAFVLVQHLDPHHESALTELLSRATSLPVHEVIDSLRVEPNHVYVIPPGKQMAIVGGVLKLEPRAGPAPSRAIDIFLASLARDRSERAIGVILSGTATDGTLGLEAIREEGGITFAQDGSARYESMPRNAVAAGCVDFELPPEEIARELGRIARHPHVTGGSREGLSPLGESASRAADASGPLPPTREAATAAAEVGAGASDAPQPWAASLGKILLSVRTHAGVDFSCYKPATIERRITRRMALSRHGTLEAYATFLQGSVRELDALYADMLIGVTSFFRNPEAFAALQRELFPKLLAQETESPVRVWVLGCSTGQEAYSLAMAYAECAGRHVRARPLQIFATDLNEAVLIKARAGLYVKNVVQDLSAERLQRFFIEEQGGYRIKKELRQLVVFARQNVLNDPPFSHMDLISCRNVLIYIEPELQRKIVPMFHYALNPGGTLFLGASESIAGFTHLFDPIGRKQKLFARKTGVRQPVPSPVVAAHHPAERRPAVPRQAVSEKGGLPELNAQREADRITLNRYAPAGVLVDAALQILQFRGDTGPYLEPPRGKASFNLLNMAREELALPLQVALKRAKKEGRAISKPGISLGGTAGSRRVTLHVIPLKNLRERCFLIFFEEAPPVAGRHPAQHRRGPGEPVAAPGSPGATRRIQRLEMQLDEARDYVQAMREQHEASSEELQASNEEVPRPTRSCRASTRKWRPPRRSWSPRTSSCVR
jgi:two-component system, chemotaxis family, CheB/CheR fusion protein